MKYKIHRTSLSRNHKSPIGATFRCRIFTLLRLWEIKTESLEGAVCVFASVLWICFMCVFVCVCVCVCECVRVRRKRPCQGAENRLRPVFCFLLHKQNKNFCFVIHVLPGNYPLFLCPFFNKFINHVHISHHIFVL